MLAAIPAIVRDLNDADALEVALIENIQRSDMHPLEEARAFRRVINARKAEEPGFSEADGKKLIADRVKRTEGELAALDRRIANAATVASGRPHAGKADDDVEKAWREAASGFIRRCPIPPMPG